MPSALPSQTFLQTEKLQTYHHWTVNHQLLAFSALQDATGRPACPQQVSTHNSHVLIQRERTLSLHHNSIKDNLRSSVTSFNMDEVPRNSHHVLFVSCRPRACRPQSALQPWEQRQYKFILSSSFNREETIATCTMTFDHFSTTSRIVSMQVFQFNELLWNKLMVILMLNRYFPYFYFLLPVP